MNTKFKIEKHLKINWLKNASKEFGAMKMVIDSKPKENNVIWSQTKKMVICGLMYQIRSY